MKICSLWSTEDVQWSKSNWTFSECQLVQEICFTWGNTGVLWAGANWKWSECSASISPTPSTGNRPGVDATTLIQPWLEEPWNPYRAGEKDKNKRKRLIKLICKVKNNSYDESKYLAEGATISVDDIKMIVKAVAGVELKMKMEK